MKISASPIPAGPKVTVFFEPVLDQPGIVKLSPFIASVMGRWSAIEAGLDSIFIMMVKNDLPKVEEYMLLKGWDRKTGAIETAAEARFAPTDADQIKATMRVVAAPADKRHELAHSTWATVAGFPDNLALLPREFGVQYGVNLTEANAKGTGEVPVATRPMLEKGCLVSQADLNALIDELDEAQTRLDALFMGHLLNPSLDPTKAGYADSRELLNNDVEIAGRVSNMKRGRRRDAKR